MIRARAVKAAKSNADLHGKRSHSSWVAQAVLAQHTAAAEALLPTDLRKKENTCRHDEEPSPQGLIDTLEAFVNTLRNAESGTSAEDVLKLFEEVSVVCAHTFTRELCS